MKAYWIAHVDVTDPDQYSQYTRRAPQAFALYGGGSWRGVGVARRWKAGLRRNAVW